MEVHLINRAIEKPKEKWFEIFDLTHKAKKEVTKIKLRQIANTKYNKFLKEENEWKIY